MAAERSTIRKRGSPLTRPHPCRYCAAAATKALIWADGRAFVATCDACEAGARRDITRHNDAVSQVVALPPIEKQGPPHRRPGESVEDCMRRKIPALVREGRPARQAVAIARSMCEREQAGKAAEEKSAEAKAVWSTAFINDLSDSAFLYISPGGQKDGEGKTVPRSLRHFPVRDPDGKLDLAHLRNALARIPQSTATGLTDEKKAQLQQEARRLLAGARAAATRKMRLVKSDGVNGGEERFVYGVVLEPETEDSQTDIYSEAEVRKAAHYFMENDGAMGLMHEALLKQGVKILESYLAPIDFEINGETVKAGTWILGVRVIDDKVWAAVKSGALTGFSIGGDALRIQEGS